MVLNHRIPACIKCAQKQGYASVFYHLVAPAVFKLKTHIIMAYCIHFQS